MADDFIDDSTFNIDWKIGGLYEFKYNGGQHTSRTVTPRTVTPYANEENEFPAVWKNKYITSSKCNSDEDGDPGVGHIELEPEGPFILVDHCFGLLDDEAPVEFICIVFADLLLVMDSSDVVNRYYVIQKLS